METLTVRHKMIKVFFTLSVELEQVGDDGMTVTRSEVFAFRGQAVEGRPFLDMEEGGTLRDRIALTLGDMERNVDEFLYQGSGWLVSQPLFIDAEVVEVSPLSGSGGCDMHTADYLRNKKGLNIATSRGIDEEGADAYCLYKAVAQQLIRQEHLISRLTDRDKLVRRLIEPAEGVKLPPSVDVKSLGRLEALWEQHLGLRIAVHVVYCDHENDVIPLRSSLNEEGGVNVVVVLFHTKNGAHYALLENPYKLFARRGEWDSKRRDYVRFGCFRCFKSFHRKVSLDNHRRFCRLPEGQKVHMPEPGDTMEFDSDSDLKRSVRFESGYVLVFDFETLQIDAPAPCSCAASVLEATRLDEEERERFEAMTESERADHLSEVYMEQGLQDLFWGEDDAKRTPKAKRRNIRSGPKVKLCPHKQKVLKEQHAFSYSYVLLRRDGRVMESQTYHGNDAAEHFISATLDLADKYLPTLSPGKPMEAMSREQKEKLRHYNSDCYICGEFMERADRVLDHDHLTGCFLGVAHTACNLMRREVPKITCFSHNLSGYDSHLLIPKLHGFGDRIRNVSAIPLNTQKFKCFSLNNQIVFLDSLAFLPDSLERLVENLRASKSDFSLLNELAVDHSALEQEVGASVTSRTKIRPEINPPTAKDSLPQHLKKLLLRKGVYPYSFATSIEALESCTQLPPKECFFNDLAQEAISDEDYEHAGAVWEAFGVSNMLEYTTLYVKTDVLLLAEAIMDMRRNIWAEFQLDMCAYLSLPMLAKDIMLKYTGAKIELISDKEMSDLLQANIRGGLSFINKRVAVARPRASDTVEGEEPSVILYVDANNLYGKAMVFPLPYRGFRWMEQEELERFDVERDVTKVSGAEGYILEVDLRYPEHLHLEHSSFPLAPHSMEISEKDISRYSKQALEAVYGKKKHSSKKLVSTFKTRENYVVHGLNLQLYKKLGMEVVKVHRGIAFEQRDFIRPYIEMCTAKRKSAPTESLKNIYKLLCNALYGKMIEGVFGRMDCKFNSDRDAALKNSSSPLYLGNLICDEDFSISFLRKKNVRMNQSWAVGFSILELSKLVMQELYYDTIQPAFGKDGCTVLMSDTDSFLLEVRAPSVDDAVSRIESVMDFSNYPKDHHLYDPSRAKALGYLKNEVPNSTITNYVGLKSKTYMLLTEDGGKQVRAKGVKKSRQASIKFEQMMECIESMKGHAVESHFIRSKDHVIRLIKGRQIAFSSFDDKRFLLCPMHSVPYGSWIAEESKCIDSAEPYCHFCVPNSGLRNKMC